MTRWPRVGSLVLVRWEDAEGVAARDAGDRDPPPGAAVEAETVGWVSERTKRHLTVASERLPPGLTERYRGKTRVPLGWVREVVRIA